MLAFKLCVGRKRFAAGGKARALSSLWADVKDFFSPDMIVRDRVLFTSNGGLSVEEKGDRGNKVIRWDCLDDKDYGGASSCEAKLMSGAADDNVSSFLRIQGNVSFDKTMAEEKKIKGGFSAVRGKLTPPPMDLRDYQGLELTLRSSMKQTFMLNLTCTSFFLDDLYQYKCVIPPSSEWQKLQVPFALFRLTARGVEREMQRSNDSLQVEAIGFLFTQKDVGEGETFHLDVCNVVAIPTITKMPPR